MWFFWCLCDWAWRFVHASVCCVVACLFAMSSVRGVCEACTIAFCLRLHWRNGLVVVWTRTCALLIAALWTHFPASPAQRGAGVITPEQRRLRDLLRNLNAEVQKDDGVEMTREWRRVRDLLEELGMNHRPVHSHLKWGL